MGDNILLVSNNDEVIHNVTKKIKLIRNNDNISVCQSSCIKDYLVRANFSIVLLHENDQQQCLRYVELIKDIQKDIVVILLTENLNSDFIYKAYDAGIYHYLSTDDDSFAFMTTLINSFKYIALNNKIKLQNLLLENSAILNPKNKMIKLKYLGEIYQDLRTYPDIKNGVFAVITIDDSVKTKISLNRLAGVLTKSLRTNDIIAEASNGYYYIIFRNTHLSEAKSALTKIQDLMGQEVLLRCGLSEITIDDFETTNKNTLDSLNSAINNNKLFASLSELKIEDGWLDDETKVNNKQYKLFYTSFRHKLRNIIEPEFLKYQQDCKSKYKNVNCIQYANEVECVFSLKDEIRHSELIIRYDGFTKLKILISNKGLESPENTKLEIALNKFNEKFLNKLLKQLKFEFLERGDDNA